jgi:hypothetical protein
MYARICSCVYVYCHFISSQYWTWLIVVQQMILLQCRSFFVSLLLCQIIKRLLELRGDGDRSLLYSLSYRLCHYNKRLNNRRTRIVIVKWLYIESSPSVYAVTWFLSFLSFFVHDESSLNVFYARRSIL